jgi:hypothetical protein
MHEEKRKLDRDVEDEWYPGTEDPPHKISKREVKSAEVKKKRFMKALRKVLQLQPEGTIRYRVMKKIKKEEFKYLHEDIEAGELWEETGDPYSCCSVNGWMAHKVGDEDPHSGTELPKTHINVEVSVPATDF